MATKDSFSVSAVVPATQVREVQITLTIIEGTGEPPGATAYAARYAFDQLAADGSIVEARQGNLIPYLTGTQINTAKAFMDAMLVKAKASI